MAAQKLTKHYQKPWQLFVSVCLTRQKILTKELLEIEQRYAQMTEKLEYEKSIFNDYEMRKQGLEAIVKATRSTKLSDKDEEEATEATRMLASIQDQEDIWNADTAKMSVAPKHSERDNDTESIHRLMDRTLHMVVKDETLLNEPSTLLPYTLLGPEETLRQASERLLLTYGVDQNTTVFHSNAPSGVVKIRYRETEPRGEVYQGAKVFFTKVHLESLANLVPIETTDPPEWLSINEIESSCQDDYFQRIKKFV